MSAAVHSLLEPRPTGASLRYWDQLRPEFQLDVPLSIDAVEFIPAGACFNWSCQPGGTIYLQQHGLLRDLLGDS